MAEKDSADLSGAQPTVEGTAPEGGGAGSGSEAGGNKRDPLSSSPTIGKTIAGRNIATGAPGDVTNVAPGEQPQAGSTHDHQTGSPDTDAKGVTGSSGKSETAAHEGPRDAGR